MTLENAAKELGFTKPEGYVLNRYMNSGKRLSALKVADEVEYYFGMPKNVALPMVRKMRVRAAAAKYRRRREEGLSGNKPHKS
ncbi:MAG: hypothetical protein M0018_05135 [Nitrospiraceae bacterium]|nr:hypothetical protein [Nitrospiraceae bacterium]